MEEVIAGVGKGWPTSFPDNLSNSVQEIVMEACIAYRNKDERISVAPNTRNNMVLFNYTDRLYSGFFGPRGREIFMTALHRHIENDWPVDVGRPSTIEQDFSIMPYIVNMMIIRTMRTNLWLEEAHMIRKDSNLFGDVLHPVAGQISETTRPYCQCMGRTKQGRV